MLEARNTPSASWTRQVPCALAPPAEPQDLEPHAAVRELPRASSSIQALTIAQETVTVAAGEGKAGKTCTQSTLALTIFFRLHSSLPWSHLNPVYELLLATAQVSIALLDKKLRVGDA